MKRLARFRGPAVGMTPSDDGTWARYEDAMAAIDNRQIMYDGVFAEKECYLRCVEIGDRMRALLNDLHGRYGVLADDHMQEIILLEQLWDDTRKASLARDTVRAPKE